VKFFRDFLHCYKEAQTSLWCTNISDIFHLTACGFGSICCNRKHILGLETRIANTTCQVTAVLHLYCLQPLYFLSGTNDSFTTLDK